MGWLGPTFLSLCQPAKRTPAHAVGAGDVSEGLAELVARANRLAPLVRASFGF